MLQTNKHKDKTLPTQQANKVERQCKWAPCLPLVRRHDAVTPQVVVLVEEGRTVLFATGCATRPPPLAAIFHSRFSAATHAAASWRVADTSFVHGDASPVL